MSTETEQEQSRTQTQINSEAFATANALEIRLNTDPVVRRFEMDLKGIREEVRFNENGEAVITEVDIGNPLANTLGQQAIMGHLNAVINHQVVQGNLKVDKDRDLYAEFLERSRKDIACDMMENLTEYGIKESHYSGIMARIMRLVELLISRTINDGERRTFSKTVTVNENSSSQVKGGGLFKGIGG